MLRILKRHFFGIGYSKHNSSVHLSGRLLGSTVLQALMLMLLAGCSDHIVSECELPAAPLPVSASLADIEERVFTPSCALPGCHAASSPQAGLNLTAGNSYAALVDVPSITDPQRMLVKSGSPQESVLVLLLRGSSSPEMPPAGTLQMAIIDSIEVWIANGASDN